MIAMKWQEEYSVRIPEIDVHHRHLFLLINLLNDAMNDGRGNEVLSEVLDELVEYTKFHFRSEEELMLKLRYPGLSEHTREHDYMVTRLAAFQEEFAAGKSVVSVKLLTFLRNWITKHILITDKKYSEFMK